MRRGASRGSGFYRFGRNLQRKQGKMNSAKGGHPDADCSQFPIWCKALSIGWLEMRITPPKGWSSSRIRKIAPETASAETIKARMAVALGGASTLKPTKIMASQQTRM